MKPEKGNGVVIMDKSDYTAKMNSILDDETKFIRLNEDPTRTTISRENRLKKYLRDLKKNGSITDATYHEIFPTGSRPGLLYGLPKVHKFDIPLRPIISSISTHSYRLAKFLVPLLRPISSSIYVVKDSFSFITELSSLKTNPKEVIMASFDIKSLFTNIPLNETINIILCLLFHNQNCFQGFSRNEFKKLLEFAVKKNHFLFSNQLYEQVDGVAMLFIGHCYLYYS